MQHHEKKQRKLCNMPNTKESLYTLFIVTLFSMTCETFSIDSILSDNKSKSG